MRYHGIFFFCCVTAFWGTENGMGADMVQPMAIVTIGGLIYGTLMTLFVIPCVYDIFNRKKDLTEREE